MDERVQQWLATRTTQGRSYDRRDLAGRKGDLRVDVVLPARDEEETVGDIVAAVRRELVETVPLVDDVVVVGSGSTDATALVAAAAGARVVAQDSVLPGYGDVAGKENT